MAQELGKQVKAVFEKWVERLGRRGTIAVGVLVSAMFLAVGGPFLMAGAGSSLLAIVVFAAILVGPAAWVLADARKCGMKQPFLWALFALLGNVIGAVVYVLVREDRPAKRSCAACGRVVEPSHPACPWCGTVQQLSKRTCGQCRTELDLGWRFCPYCRTEASAPS